MQYIKLHSFKIKKMRKYIYTSLKILKQYDDVFNTSDKTCTSLVINVD